MEKNKIHILRIVLIVVLIVLSIISLHIGIEEFSLIGLIEGKEEYHNIFFRGRLPRLISVIITGISLSVAGLIMQTISANKFVSPTTAGTLDWARLGILIAFFITGTASSLLKMGFAFVITIIGSGIFMMILSKTKYRSSAIIPLIGLMLGNVVSAISTFIAYKYDLIQNMSSWLMGSFTLITKGNYELLYIGIPFLIISLLYASKFTIASMGSDVSTSLGLNHKLVLTIGLVIVSVISAVVIVTVGTIPFVGLVVPNIVSIYRGDNVKRTLLETGLIGAILLLICDILSRVILFPYEISISVIMSVIGSFMFLYIIFKNSRKAR